jgi:hypothetical protein
MFPDRHFASRRDAQRYAREMRTEGYTARIVLIAGGTYLVTPGFGKRKPVTPGSTEAPEAEHYRMTCAMCGGTGVWTLDLDRAGDDAEESALERARRRPARRR